MYTPSEEQNKRREANFVYHAPKEGQPARYQSLRDAAKQLSLMLDSNVPKSRELSLAQTALEECVMWANAGIARNE